MEQLHASGPQPQRLPSERLQDAAKRMLLLDCDSRRREVRAEALINRGVLVDRAAETVVARALWRPGTYDLVLIDLRGADADCAAFIAFVRGESAHQKFGFYVAQPPYVTASAAEGRSSMHRQALPPVGEGHSQFPDLTGNPYGTGLSVAARRIAASRELARVRARTREELQAPEVREPSPVIAASDAVRLAGRLLGGS